MTEAYAVFEGGGVKGSALVGALARVQEEGIGFKGLAGASAGAIVASLTAVGFTANELKPIMDNVDYMSFLDGQNLLPLATLRDRETALRGLGAKLPSIVRDVQTLEGRCSLVRWNKMRQLVKRYRAEIEQAKSIAHAFGPIIDAKGFYRSTSFLRWIRELLERKGNKDESGQVTFGAVADVDLATGLPKGPVLKIVAADLNKRGPRVYDVSQFAGNEIAVAVQASMSIPFFFEPFPEGQSFLVDGGLLSNFPAWTFDREKAMAATDLPVIGFRLRQKRPPEPPIDSFQAYVTALVATALEGTDRLQTRRIDRFVPINITTPADIPATKFDLTADERDTLYRAGYDEAETALSSAQNRSILGL